jgi:hypothetical protein
MPTPFESADLILKLYELRREETMRKAREFVAGFDPQSIEEFNAAVMSPQGNYIRMVYGYWEMAASLVMNGAIDAIMFDEANGEHISVYSKVEPFVGEFRRILNQPGFLKSLEKVCTDMPGGVERVAAARERSRQQIAARAASKDKA